MLFFVVLAVFLANVQAYKVYDCGSDATIHYVNIDGCTNSQGNCILKRGTSAKLEISFTPWSRVESVRTKVSVKQSWWLMPMTVKEAYSCSEHINCPLQVGEANLYTVNYYISTDILSGSGTLYWKLKDQDGDTLVCLRVPGKLK